MAHFKNRLIEAADIIQEVNHEIYLGKSENKHNFGMQFAVIALQYYPKIVITLAITIAITTITTITI